VTTCGGTEAPLPDVAAVWDPVGRGVDAVDDMLLEYVTQSCIGSSNRLDIDVQTTESPYYESRAEPLLDGGVRSAGPVPLARDYM
jgi:hypothetical protein